MFKFSWDYAFIAILGDKGGFYGDCIYPKYWDRQTYSFAQLVCLNA